MLANTHFRSLMERLSSARSGATTTEFTYLLVALVVLTAFGAAILGDDVRAFFRGFEFDQNGIRFG